VSAFGYGFVDRLLIGCASKLVAEIEQSLFELDSALNLPSGYARLCSVSVDIACLAGFVTFLTAIY